MGKSKNIDLRARIMEVAERLFYTEGVRATGTEKMMSVSHVAKATLPSCAPWALLSKIRLAAANRPPVPLQEKEKHCDARVDFHVSLIRRGAGNIVRDHRSRRQIRGIEKDIGSRSSTGTVGSAQAHRRLDSHRRIRRDYGYANRGGTNAS